MPVSKDTQSWHRNVCGVCYRYYLWRWRKKVSDVGRAELVVSICNECQPNLAPHTHKMWAVIVEERYEDE